MISFYDGQIADILPKNLISNPGVQALSYALREGTRMLCDYAKRAYIYTAIDQQPEKMLDLLAVELRTQHYKGSMDPETKRGLVKSSLVWHMTAGTPGAVEGLVSAVFGQGKVEEWFEYGGEPYCFKITTDIESAFTPEKNRLIQEMLRKVKNTRSHLQSLEIQRTIDHKVYSAIGQRLTYKPPAITDGYSVVEEAIHTAHTGGGTRNIHRSTITETEGR